MSSVAGEGRVVGVPKFHSWGKWTMPLTNINSDWMSNVSSGLCSILLYYIIYAGPLSYIFFFMNNVIILVTYKKEKRLYKEKTKQNNKLGMSRYRF